MKAFSKRLLSMLVVLAMVLSMVPVVGLPAIEAEATAGLDITAAANALNFSDPANLPTTCPACKGTDVVWEPLPDLTDTQVKITASCHYYVPQGGLTSTSTIKPIWLNNSSATVCLHLNGQTISTAGNIYVQSGTLNILGNGTMQIASGGNPAITTDGKVYIYGGSFTGGPNAGTPAIRMSSGGSAASKLYLYGSASINGTVQMYRIASNGEVKDGAREVVVSNTVYIKALEISPNSKVTLNGSFAGVIETLKFLPTVTAEGNKLVEGEVTAIDKTTGLVSIDRLYSHSGKGKIWLEDGSCLVLATVGENGAVAQQMKTAASTFDNPANSRGLAWCEACQQVKTWTPAASTIGTVTTTGGHYYLTADVTAATGGTDMLFLNASNITACLNLNGHKITSTVGNAGRIRVNANSTVNIMGDGQVEKAADGATFVLRSNGAKVNLYGGTYSYASSVAANANKMFQLCEDVKAAYKLYINLYGNTVVNGGVWQINANNAQSFAMTLSDSAQIHGLTMEQGGAYDETTTEANDTLTINAGWNGIISNLTLPAEAIDGSTGLVSSENVVCNSANGKVTLADGRVLKKAADAAQLKLVTMTADDPFDPANNDGQAYCEACGTTCSWTPVSAVIGDVNASGHYYLANDFEAAARLMWLKNGAKVCLNLNGKTITGTGTNAANANFYIANGTLNVMGEGTIQKSAEVAGAIFSMDTTKLNIYGGTFIASPKGNLVQGGTNADKTAATVKPTITVSGDADLQGEITLAGECTGSLTLAGNASVDKIVVSINSTLTLKDGWNGIISNLTLPAEAIDEATGLVSSERVVCNSANGKVTLADGRFLKKAANADQLQVVTMTADDPFDPANNDGLAYCEACKQVKTWTAKDAAIGTAANGGHYYLTADITAESGDTIYLDGTHTACLHLNGHKITSNQASVGRIRVNYNATLNIMGDGQVEKTADGAMFVLRSNAAKVNLYGGTYSYASSVAAKANKMFQLCESGASAHKLYINLYGNTVVNGGVWQVADNNAQSFVMTLSDSAQIHGLTMEQGGAYDETITEANDTLTINAGWNGSITKLTLPAEAIDGSTGLVSSENVVCNSANGKVTLADGRVLKKAANAAQLQVVTMDADDPFDPANNDGLAYCEVCDTTCSWTPVTGVLGDVTVSGHYYLANDFEASSRVMFIKTDKVCLNLNGKTITGVGTDATNANIYLASKTFNVMGEGTIQKSASTAGSVFSMDSGRLNIVGGTFVASPSGNLVQATTAGDNALATATPTITVSGNADLQGEVLLSGECTGSLTLADNASIEKVTVSINSKLTLKDGWNGEIKSVLFKSLGATDSEIPAANAVVEGTLGENATITNVDGREITQSGNGLAAEAVKIPVEGEFDPENYDGFAYCDVCDTIQSWTPVTAEVGDVTASGHYYLANDFEAAARLMWLKNGAKVCLNLNGKTITGTGTNAANANFYINNGSLNVMGEGTIQKSAEAAGSVFSMESTKLNIVGGTFIASPSGNLVQATTAGDGALDTATPTITVSGNADLQGEVLLSGECTGSLTLAGNASIDKVTVSINSTLTLKDGWNGKIKSILFKSLSLFDTKVPALNAVAEGTLGENATITNVDGRAITVVDGGLVVEAMDLPEVGKFDPENYNGYAYCPVCGDEEFVLWEAFVYTPDVKTAAGHYYLTEDVTYETGVFLTNNGRDSVHLNMNGFSVTGTGEASYAFAPGNGALHVFNTEETESVVIGGIGNNTSGVYMNGSMATASFYLYDGVTMKKPVDTTYPIVRIGTNGGKFVMNGGTLDVSDNESEWSGTSAVYITGRNFGYTDLDDTVAYAHYGIAEFIMNDGTIIGSNNREYTVRIGTSRLTEDDVVVDGEVVGTNPHTPEMFQGAAKFTMNGGEIQGTLAIGLYASVDLNNSVVIKTLDVKNVEGNIVDATDLTESEIGVGTNYTTGDLPFVKVNSELQADYFTYGVPVYLNEANQLYIGSFGVVTEDDTYWYTTAAEALQNLGDGYLKLIADKPITLTRDTVVDCCGRDLTVDCNGFQLTMVDSENDDYIDYGIWTVTNGTVAPKAEFNGGTYVVLTEEEENTYSAHRLDMVISDVTLRTAKAGMYYTAQFNCDEFLAPMVQSYGVALSVTGMPGEDFKKGSYTVIDAAEFAPNEDNDYTVTANSGAVVNIFSENNSAEKNAAYGKMPIYGVPYLDIQGYDGSSISVVGQEGEAYSLQDVLVALYQAWERGNVTEEDEEAFLDFYATWKAQGAINAEYQALLPKLEEELAGIDYDTLPAA